MARTRRKWGESPVGKTLTFRRGVHPREAAGGKHETGAKPIENAAAPSMVAVPLLQHAGAPAKPMVKPGTPVLMGQKIAAADGFVSAAVHSPVSGIVKSIQTRIVAGGRRVDAVIIENNALDEWDTSLMPVRDRTTRRSFLRRFAKRAWSAWAERRFPRTLSFRRPAEKRIDTVILNGAECEPYLSADHRVMLEETEAVVDGLRSPRGSTGAKTAVHRRGGQQDRRHRGVAPRWGGARKCAPARRSTRRAGKRCSFTPLRAGVSLGRTADGRGLCGAQRFYGGRHFPRRARGPAGDRPRADCDGAVRQPKNLHVRIGVDIDSVIEQCGGADAQVNKIVWAGR